MTFKYFDNPELFVALRDKETTCDTCGQTRKCFNAELFYGTDELKSICPKCLANGVLANRDAFTCAIKTAESKFY